MVRDGKRRRSFGLVFEDLDVEGEILLIIENQVLFGDCDELQFEVVVDQLSVDGHIFFEIRVLGLNQRTLHLLPFLLSNGDVLEMLFDYSDSFFLAHRMILVVELEILHQLPSVIGDILGSSPIVADDIGLDLFSLHSHGLFDRHVENQVLVQGFDLGLEKQVVFIGKSGLDFDFLGHEKTVLHSIHLHRSSDLVLDLGVTSLHRLEVLIFESVRQIRRGLDGEGHVVQSHLEVSLGVVEGEEHFCDRFRLGVQRVDFFSASYVLQLLFEEDMVGLLDDLFIHEGGLLVEMTNIAHHPDLFLSSEHHLDLVRVDWKGQVQNHSAHYLLSRDDGLLLHFDLNRPVLVFVVGFGLTHYNLNY